MECAFSLNKILKNVFVLIANVIALYKKYGGDSFRQITFWPAFKYSTLLTSREHDLPHVEFMGPGTSLLYL